MHAHKIQVNIKKLISYTILSAFGLIYSLVFGLPLTGAYDPGVGYCVVMNVYCLV